MAMIAMLSSYVAVAAATPPFSFTLGGVPFHSGTTASGWNTSAATFTEGGRERTDFTWTSTTGMQVEVAQTSYVTTGSLEWVLAFRNTGAAPSPPLCNVTALDVTLPNALLGGAPRTVHRFIGSHASPTDYMPLIYSVPSKGAAPAPAPPGPAPPSPKPPIRLVHGNASLSEMLDGYRLWSTKPGDKPGRTFDCPTARACQTACAGAPNKTCLGATWVHPGTLGPVARWASFS